MAMTLIQCRVGAETIQISLSLHIPHPDALAAREYHVERAIVVRTVFLF
jgi:hypothetical protein